MSSGAVGSVRRVRNPVEAARAVMERSEHALLVGDEAAAWAEAQGLQMEDEVSAMGHLLVTSAPRWGWGQGISRPMGRGYAMQI